VDKRLRKKREREELLSQQSESFSRPRFGLERVCFYVIQWGTYLVLFAPLIVIKSSFFPFITPKTIFFRIVVEIILAAYLFLAITTPRYRPKINALTVGIIIFLGVLLLTSFTGINFERSFWSTYERMTGLWTIFHLFVFFIILTSCFKKRRDWEKILGVSVLVGVILSFYVLLSDEASTRGGGTIGNSSFMAAYLLFDIFFALILLFSNFFKKGGWSLFWQIFAGVSLIPLLWVLFISTARGAIMAFEGGLFLLGLGYLIFSQRKILCKIGLAIVLFLVVLGIVSAVLQPAFLKDKIEYNVQEMKSRFVVWEMGWKGWQERFWLGWGPENFNIVFTKHFNPCMFIPECGSEIWFDRAHNIIFDIAVTSGLIGLLSYLAIFGVAIYGIFRTLPKVVEKRNIFLPLGIGVLLIVYFIQNSLVFDIINSYMMFFLSLAFVSFLVYPVKSHEVGISPEAKSFNRVNPFLALVIIIVTILALWFGNIQPARSAYYIAQMVNPYLKIEESSVLFQKSLNSPMLKYETREQFAKRMVEVARDPKQNKEALKEGFGLATKEMEKSVEKNPLDFRPHLFLGKVYLDFYYLFKDQEKLNLAEKTLQKAVELSPRNQQGYWGLAQVRTYQRRFGEAFDLFQKAIDLEPRFGQSYWYLVLAYKAAGQYPLAKEKLVELEEQGYYNWKSNVANLKTAIEIYQALGDDFGSIALYQRVIKIQPKDPQLWGGLAATYARLGEKEKAKEAAAKVVEIDPNLLPQTERFLKALEEKEIKD
jgi:O-antigen ligase/tetratricopeptide (TPR) repeat protein